MNTTKLWNTEKRKRIQILLLSLIFISLGFYGILGSIIIIIGFLYLRYVIFIVGGVIGTCILYAITTLIIIKTLEKYDESYLDLSKYYSTGKFYKKELFINNTNIVKSLNNSMALTVEIMNNIADSLRKKDFKLILNIKQLLFKTSFNNIAQIHVIELENYDIIIYMKIYKYINYENKQDYEIFIGPVNKDTSLIIKEKLKPEIEKVLKKNGCLFIKN